MLGTCILPSNTRRRRGVEEVKKRGSAAAAAAIKKESRARAGEQKSFFTFGITVSLRVIVTTADSYVSRGSPR